MTHDDLINRAEQEDARLTPRFLELIRAEKLTLEQRAEKEATGKTIHGIRAALGAYKSVWTALDSAVQANAESAKIADIEGELRVRRRALELAVEGERDYWKRAWREVPGMEP